LIYTVKAIKENEYLLALYIKGFLPDGSVPDVVSTLGNINVINENGGYLIRCDIQGPDNGFIQLCISHVNIDDEMIVDAKLDEPACSIGMNPGTEYNITYTLRDWMDHSEYKTP